jgi:transcriptional regulator GlxA family with amidase domain
MKREIGLLVFPGFQLLDMSGPLAAFEVANSLAAGQPYRLSVLSLSGGAVTCSAGIALATEALDNRALDTLILPGGRECLTEGPDELVAALRQIAPLCRRVASICTGAFRLAQVGLLDGRRATTHWRHITTLRQRFPRIRVDAESFFVEDGGIWTATGTNAGIDLSLAMIEQDFGLATARATAQMMVVHQRRPGNQTQFAGYVDAEPRLPAIRKALNYARTHLHERLSVEDLAEIACLSPRQFSRVFYGETGITPAKAVERLRIETAKLRLETGPEPIETIAQRTGFDDPERMRRAFLRTYGQPPQAIRRAIRLS